MSDINQRNAGLFSAAAYAPIGSLNDTDTQAVTKLGWREATDGDGNILSAQGERGSNTQFRVFVNDETRQVVFAFKGSNSVADFKSDILDSGATQYQAIHDQAEKALGIIQKSDSYAGYNIITDGHSLGGGMAQTFSLEFKLNGFAQNSLPVSMGAIEQYIVNQGLYVGMNIDEAVAAYQADHYFTGVNVAGDIATLKYSTIEHQLYINNRGQTTIIYEFQYVKSRKTWSVPCCQQYSPGQFVRTKCGRQ